MGKCHLQSSGRRRCQQLALWRSLTRAEMTDAAMSMRAECVMLNKGPLLRRRPHDCQDIRNMEPRQYKKRALFSKLIESLSALC